MAVAPLAPAPMVFVRCGGIVGVTAPLTAPLAPSVVPFVYTVLGPILRRRGRSRLCVGSLIPRCQRHRRHSQQRQGQQHRQHCPPHRGRGLHVACFSNLGGCSGVTKWTRVYVDKGRLRDRCRSGRQALLNVHLCRSGRKLTCRSRASLVTLSAGVAISYPHTLIHIRSHTHHTDTHTQTQTHTHMAFLKILFIGFASDVHVYLNVFSY